MTNRSILFRRLYVMLFAVADISANEMDGKHLQKCSLGLTQK